MKIFLSKTFFEITNLEHNYNKIIDIYDKSLSYGCDLLVFSELSITGFPIYDKILDAEFIKKNNDFVEKIIDYTKNKKTRILLGCPYSIEKNITKDGIIQNSKLFNSVILIDNGYINAVHNKTNILKNNLFDEYKYFDKEVILNDISYENDNFDVLIGDEINDNKNILFIKERDTDFILCLDSEISKNIEIKKKQLSKISKWTNKNIIYMNNFAYDIKKGYSFFGEIFVLNNIGEIEYSNMNIEENIIQFETKFENGNLNIYNINLSDKKDEKFIDIIAKNYKDKIIVVETDKYINFKESNIIQITFNQKIKDKKINFIDFNNYVKNLEYTSEIKEIIIKNLYKNVLYFSYITNQ